jgi:hypothetical protein
MSIFLLQWSAVALTLPSLVSGGVIDTADRKKSDFIVDYFGEFEGFYPFFRCQDGDVS